MQAAAVQAFECYGSFALLSFIGVLQAACKHAQLPDTCTAAKRTRRSLSLREFSGELLPVVPLHRVSI